MNNNGFQAKRQKNETEYSKIWFENIFPIKKPGFIRGSHVL